MGEIVGFVSKAELERLRLIREAHAIYDSIFPPIDTCVTSDKTHIEHNESAFTLIADIPGNTDFRCNAPAADAGHVSNRHHAAKSAFQATLSHKA